MYIPFKLLSKTKCSSADIEWCYITPFRDFFNPRHPPPPGGARHVHLHGHTTKHWGGRDVIVGAFLVSIDFPTNLWFEIPEFDSLKLEQEISGILFKWWAMTFFPFQTSMQAVTNLLNNESVSDIDRLRLVMLYALRYEKESPVQLMQLFNKLASRSAKYKPGVK